ncbi:MAG: TetR/AcrR family transcriptional regulator [Gammaproteobacteria bacterium]|nr:TetR/AcrR family transcriptional regulator [Gammaproteobacteria bacterium]MDH5801871.1 TetR/AcrR family transcriptional regulator [Gammaproteobacteria bacterium]
MAPKVSDQHQEARRQQILKAALVCFAANGFHKTTMRDICREAGLSTGAVYSYFENKEVLIRALNEWGRQLNQAAFNAGTTEAGSQETLSPQAVMSKVLRAFILRAGDPTMRNAIRADAMFMTEMLTDDKLAHMGCEEYEQQLVGTIINIVTQMQETGCMDAQCNSRAVAEVLFSLVQGVYWQILINPNLDLHAYADAVEATVFGRLWISTPGCVEPNGGPEKD